MAIPDTLRALIGDWTGDSSLWLTPSDPARVSRSTLHTEAVAQDRFLLITYTWEDGGRAQDGALLLGAQPEEEVVSAAWIDSWHMGHAMMTCAGGVQDDGAIWVRGGYAAPPGPDWGWRITISAPKDDAFTLRMFNISPEGDEALAVEATYERADQEAPLPKP